MFRITFVDREQHPRSELIPVGYPAIAVNDTVGGRLKLRMGYTYYFNVKSNPNYPGVHFYLTTDPSGGPNDQSRPVANTVPISSGAFNLEINDTLPKIFYYQLQEASNCGGICVVDESS